MAVNACSSVRYGPATQERAWPGYLGTAARGSAGTDVMAPDPQPVWRARLARGITGTPAIAEDVVAVLLLDQHLALLERATGDVIWRRHVGGAPAAGPLLRDDRIYVATQGRGGGLAAYRLDSGRPAWHTRVGDIGATPVLHGDAVYAATVEGGVVSVDASSGRIRWRSRVSGGIRAEPVVAGGHVVVATTTDSLFVLETFTGRVTGRYGTDGAVLAAPALAGAQLLIGTMSGRLVALDTASWATVWRRDLGSAIVGAVGVRSDTAWALTERGLLWRVPLARPERAESTSVAVVARAGPMPTASGVFVAAVNGEVSLFDGSGRQRWSARVRAPLVEPPLQDGTMLFVVSQRGEVVAFR
jgi:outer membrane protein assembly factor BamB